MGHVVAAVALPREVRVPRRRWRRGGGCRGDRGREGQQSQSHTCPPGCRCTHESLLLSGRTGGRYLTATPRRRSSQVPHGTLRYGRIAAVAPGAGPRSAARCPRTAGRARHRAAPAAAGRRGRGGPPAAPRGRRPARRLRPAAAAPARRAAARRGRRADRGRQVDAGQQPGRPAGQRVRRAAPDDPVGGAGLPPRRRRVVRGARGCCPASARPPAQLDRPRPPCSSCRASGIPAGLAVLDAPDIDSVVDAQPRARHPAARRRGHVAVRHHRRPLRRRGALGVPARRRHPRAPPSRWCSTGCRRRRPRRCAATSRAMLDRARAGEAPLFVVPETTRRTTAMLPPDVIDPLRTWLYGIAADAARAGRRRAAHPRRRGALASGPASSARGGRRRAGRGRGAAPRGGRRGVRRRARRGRRRAMRRRLAAARRGAGPLAGVRRHRRADARPGVEGVGRLRDRVTAAAQGQAAAGRGPGRGAASPASRRWCVGRGRPRPPSGPARRGGRRPAGAAAARRPTTCAAARPSSATRPRGPSATGRAACSSWCAREGAGKRTTARHRASASTRSA